MNPYQYQVNDFSLEKDELVLAETLFHNANGYIGIRSNYEEGYPEGYQTIRGTYLNGVYDFTTMNQAEKLHGLIEEKQTMLNVVDTQGIELYIDEERFSLFVGKCEQRSRVLDMRKGVTQRNVIWESPSGKKVQICITRMTSFIHQNLYLVKYEVTPLNFSGMLEFKSIHEGQTMNYCDPTDPRVAGEAEQYIHVEAVKTDVVGSTILSHTSKSGIRICSIVRNVLLQAERVLTCREKSVMECLKVKAEEGKTHTLYKYTVLGDSVRYENLEDIMAACMERLVAKKPEEIYREQEMYLEQFWSNSALEVEGDHDLQSAILYNQYQLLQSVSKDPYGNIAAKGLSGEGYEGHYFWDTEMYMQPFFILNERTVARNLIEYRFRTLDYARENARDLGHIKGALYPWRTIMGKECSGYFPSGTAAYHINADVAYSVVSYYLATKDLAFMEQCGAEILVETARLWMDLGCFYKNQFHINEVTGPDEYTCMVNNNYYTNVMAQYNLIWAAKMMQILESQGCASVLTKKLGITQEEIKSFETAAKVMVLVYDEDLGINPQDDSFLQKNRWDIAATPKEMFPLLMNYHPLTLYRYQVCKQADTVMAHFVLEDAQSLETIRNSYAYYEKITTHDSSLSTCIFSIMAARLGMTQKAYEYFGESAKLDLFNTHKNTKDGIHTANMGGTYMAMVYGFGGLRIKESGISFRPVLPQEWDGYRFRVLFEDSKLIISVNRDTCIITLEEGTAKKVQVYDKEYELQDWLEIPVE